MRSSTSSAARSSTPAATPRSRSRSCSTRARAGGPSCPRARRTGAHEAVELRDGGDRFGGKGVAHGGRPTSTARSRDARRRLRRRSTSAALDPTLIDLDGTDNKARLGANAILGVSLAVAKAAADELELPLYRYVGGANAHVLPVPMMNVLNGGAHADNNVDFQEFMIDAGRRRVASREALRWGVETYHALKSLLHERGLSTAVGDEGGFAPTSPSNEDAVQPAGRGDRARRLHARRRHRDRARPRDVASSTDDGALRAGRRGPHACRPASSPTIWADWCDRYPIVSIEDGMAEDDWDGWAALTDALGDRVQLVGDDLFVTNTERLEQGIDRGVGQLDPRQGEPDRHADRDARHRRARDAVELHER